MNINEKDKNLIFSTLSEFAKFVSYSDNFESKLLEHGKVIIKKNAINIGMNLFVDWLTVFYNFNVLRWTLLF